MMESNCAMAADLANCQQRLCFHILHSFTMPLSKVYIEGCISRASFDKYFNNNNNSNTQIPYYFIDKYPNDYDCCPDEVMTQGVQ